MSYTSNPYKTPMKRPAAASLERSVTEPAPTTPASISTSRRKRPRTKDNKLDTVFEALEDVRWTLPEFLLHLFRDEDRSPATDRRVRSILDGSTKPYLGEVIQAVYDAAGHVGPRKNDKSAPRTGLYGQSRETMNKIEHSRSALEAWVVDCAGSILQSESWQMIQASTGLHARAAAKESGPHIDQQVSWKRINAFTFENLNRTALEHAPATCHLLHSYIHNPSHDKEGKAVAIRQRRPEAHVLTDVIMSMTCARSSWANFLPMCRGIWLFSAKAPKTVYRVESRLGHSVSLSTVTEALKVMSKETRRQLQASTAHHSIVFDNTQAYARVREHGLGKESRMITGLAGTAIELERCPPGALALQPLLDSQAAFKRQNLTAETILEDLDTKHSANVRTVQFLTRLVEFVPALKSRYHLQLQEWSKELLQKKPIPPDTLSKVTPLATNSANEMTVQGMQQGVKDFLSTQMGINSETVREKPEVQIMSGDGKTFGMCLLMKKLKSMDPDDFESFRSMVPLLELWHTRWTRLSVFFREYWGDSKDVSSLAHLANLIRFPTPPDLRKVDYYQGARLLELVLNAHILNCWELYFKTDDLVKHFEQSISTTSFDSLKDLASQLSTKHATTEAYESALHGNTSQPSELGAVPNGSGQDIVAANCALLMRDAIQWIEARNAVADGDAGRVWEMCRFWLFTFAGSGNPFYTQYLLETYCCIKWDWPDALRETVFMNWLVNLHGQPGHFLERDLLQEHFNFWLEDMAQHKGKEFDEPFIREVLAPNVLYFIRLKDVMEEVVDLEKRSKHHAEPHLDVELGVLMKALRGAEANKRQPERGGTLVPDDFHAGVKALKEDKIKNFIHKSSFGIRVLRLYQGKTVEEMQSADYDETDTTDGVDSEIRDLETSDSPELAPLPRIVAVERDYAMVNETIG